MSNEQQGPFLGTLRMEVQANHLSQVLDAFSATMTTEFNDLKAEINHEVRNLIAGKVDVPIMERIVDQVVRDRMKPLEQRIEAIELTLEMIKSNLNMDGEA